MKKQKISEMLAKAMTYAYEKGCIKMPEYIITRHKELDVILQDKKSYPATIDDINKAEELIRLLESTVIKGLCWPYQHEYFFDIGKYIANIKYD